MYLGLRKVSCLWRCPQFRGVLIEGFHCTQLVSEREETLDINQECVFDVIPLLVQPLKELE